MQCMISVSSWVNLLRMKDRSSKKYQSSLINPEIISCAIWAEDVAHINLHVICSVLLVIPNYPICLKRSEGLISHVSSVYNPVPCPDTGSVYPVRRHLSSLVAYVYYHCLYLFFPRRLWSIYLLIYLLAQATTNVATRSRNPTELPNRYFSARVATGRCPAYNSDTAATMHVIIGVVYGSC